MNAKSSRVDVYTQNEAKNARHFFKAEMVCIDGNKLPLREF